MKVDRYLAERRRLGFLLISPGLALKRFAQYVDDLGYRGPLTIEVMTDWARRNQSGWGTPETWARRLKLLRSFARHLRQFEPRTEVPDDSVFGPLQEQRAPHIYREQEIVDLLATARTLTPVGGLRPATFETLFGLLASTGLRVSEALNLLDADVDLQVGLLTVRQTKSAKSRQLPLHRSTVAALQRYRRLRNQFIPVTAQTPFFVRSRGRRLGERLADAQVRWLFIQLRKQLGWLNRGAHEAPRIHDLRHSFAVRRDEHGTDIDQAMLALSTYMGHAKISHTYGYLTGVPELMALASGKFEQFAQTAEVRHG